MMISLVVDTLSSSKIVNVDPIARGHVGNCRSERCEKRILQDSSLNINDGKEVKWTCHNHRSV